MKKVEFFETMVAKCKETGTHISDQLTQCVDSFEDANFLEMIFGAYMSTQRCEAQYIVISNYMRDNEIDPFLKNMDKVGITEFAVTNQSTALMDNLFEYQKRGWMVKRLEEVNTERVHWTAKGIKGFEKKPAIILAKEQK